MRVIEEQVLHQGSILATVGGVIAGYTTAIGTGRYIALVGALAALFVGYGLSIGHLRTMSQSPERDLLWR